MEGEQSVGNEKDFWKRGSGVSGGSGSGVHGQGTLEYLGPVPPQSPHLISVSPNAHGTGQAPCDNQGPSTTRDKGLGTPQT